MKRKFLILTLCFTLIFTSLNYKRSYANVGLISAPILATVATLAVATGVVINNDEDLYSLGNMFYNYNKGVWDSVVLAFNSSVAFNKVTNKLTVGKDFLDIFKSCFSSAKSGNLVGQYGAIPIYDSHPSFDLAGFSAGVIINKDNIYNFGDFEVTISNGDASAKYKGNSFGKTVVNAGFYPISLYIVKNSTPQYGLMCIQQLSHDKTYVSSLFGWLDKGVILEYPDFNTYDDSKIKDNDSIGVYVPNNLGDLKGVSSDEIIGSSAPSWSGNGDISIPNVSNPSISIDNTVSFPNTNVDTDNPSIPDTDNPNSGLEIFPPWGGGIDFTPVTQSSFTDKFPFSLASDIKNILNIFDVDPIAPKFKVPIVSETIELDLTEFEQLASLIRFFVLVGFIISLILITRSVIG